MGLKGTAELPGEVHLALRGALIEPVLHKGAELRAEEAALGQDAAALLHDIAEIAVDVLVRDHDRLAEKRAQLGPAYVEHVREPRKVGERRVRARADERHAEARAVHVQVHPVLAAGGGYLLELGEGVDKAALRGLGDVHHARLGKLQAVGVGPVRHGALAHLPGGELAVARRELYHLVACGLDGPGLVHGDVPRDRRYNALMRAQRGADHGEVGLRAADDEVYRRLRRGALFTYHRRGGIAVFVVAVAGGLVVIDFLYRRQNLRQRALKVVALEPYHAHSASTFIFPSSVVRAMAFSPPAPRSTITAAITSSMSFCIVRRRILAP